MYHFTLTSAFSVLDRKSRVDVDINHTSESPGEISEENPLGSLGLHGMPEMEPTSPSQNSVDIDHGQHMPHLLCS